MRYDYTIFYAPGKNMFLANSLSRPNGYACDEIARMI